MGKLKVPHTFPVPPLNKGTLNSLKITEPSPECSAEQGTFGGSLFVPLPNIRYIIAIYNYIESRSEFSGGNFFHTALNTALTSLPNIGMYVITNNYSVH